MAQSLHKIVRAIPKLINDGKMHSQNATNIIGFLEAEAYLLNCEIMPTEIILVSDGVESSSYVEGQGLGTGVATLPKPREGLLRGCALTIVGVAQLARGSAPVLVKNVIAEWVKWCDVAGISRFKPLPHF